MKINKIHTNRKKEEPSSLTNQKFFRKFWITEAIRRHLGILGSDVRYRNGVTITETAKYYGVSRKFIYLQSAILRQQSPLLFGNSSISKTSKLDLLLANIRFFLEGKLETKSALEGLSNFATSLGLEYTSTSFISQLLEVAGTLVGNTYKSSTPLTLTFLWDEVYAGDCPVLVTIDARSMMVLDIQLVTGSFTHKDWEQSYGRVSNNQVQAKVIIKDQGLQMKAAVQSLSDAIRIGADTYHAIPHRLGKYYRRFNKEVQSAEDWEAKRATRFANTKTYKTALKKEKQWTCATYRTLQATDRLEWFEEYYFRMLHQLRPITSKGLPRNKQTAEAIILECLDALSMLDIETLDKQLVHIQGLLDSGELLHFMDQVPQLYEQLQTIVSPNTAWIWALYWQWDKKSYQTHAPKVQQRAKQEAAAAKALLMEYYEFTTPKEQVNPFKKLHQKVFFLLDDIVQASSLVETFNSILKPHINSARGQVSQSLLNLVKFRHNHRIFKRGKRQGKAPVELLNNMTLEQSWIDFLMDQFKAAFEQHQVVSLKQLHHIICPKLKQVEDKLEAQHLVEKLGQVA